MKKWNLTKLSIDSFKVFNNFNDSFESDLIVFDGPNGYGKTTIFDALQLLFSGSIPRIPLLAKSIKVRSDKEFEANLYRHSKSDGDVVIKAEFKRGSESTVLVRMAKKLDIDTASNNKPDVFSIFKLFSLSSFDENIENASLIRDEKSHLQKLFGQFFLENYSVLNYMSQENNSLVIPNSGAQRFGQISHLLKLDNIVEKIENTKKLIATCRTKQNVLGDAEKDLEDQINQLNSNLTKKGNAEPTYQKLGVGENIAQWDKEEPIFDDSLQSYHVLARSIDLIKNIIENKNEIEIRIKNEKISSFITKDELPTAIRIGLHFRKYDALMAQRKSIDSYNVQYEMLDVPSSKIQLINIKKLTNTDDILLKNLVSSITNRDELNKDIDGSVKDSIHLNGMRKDILNAMHHNDNHE
jgi:exonuclease SbcC